MALKAYALTTVSRFKSYAGISGAGDDSILEILINACTEFVENYCNRRFKQTAYSQEMYSPERGNVLLLKNYPVSSSATFTLEIRNAILNEDAWEEVDSEDYFVDYASGIIQQPPGMIFQRGVNRYRVTYTAGFNFNNTDTFLSDTEAGDVEIACYELVKVVYLRRKGDSGVESERIGDYGITFRATVFENPAIREVLDKYSRQDSSIGAVSPAND